MEKPSGKIIGYTLKALSTMKQFYTEEKYYDVQLRVDTKLFKCHRLWLSMASEYFDTMFSSNFQESNATMNQPITLHEMDGTAFEEILRFIYSGDISVNDSNVLQLLLMNDFLRLRIDYVKEECIKYVQSRSQEHTPISNAFDLLSFAYMKAENVLSDYLSAHICQHLHHYSKDVRLVEIDFGNLNALLKFSKDYILSLPGSQNVVLEIIHNWINHDRGGRAEYRDELMKNIDLANISPDFALSLINRLEKIADEFVNYSRDIESPSERKTPGMETKVDLINGDTRRDAIISCNFTNMSGMKNDKTVYSPSCIVSNLSWKVGVRRSNGNLGIYLNCYGTDKALMWKCWANATFTLVSHKEERENLVAESERYLYASNLKYSSWGLHKFLSWSDLSDPENGYIRENSFSLHAHIHADVTFCYKD